MSNKEDAYNPWLHRFAKIVAGATFLLIVIGGLVTSTGSGLSVPDWPNTYGHFMFSYPLSGMVGGILYEHGHRMIASVVGLLTTILAVWLWIKEPRRWVKWLGVSAFVAVLTQGILGGLTVLYLLPTPISVLHGCLAQTFFCMTIAIAVVTSPGWQEQTPKLDIEGKPNPQNVAFLTLFAVFGQLIIGATMRHMGAGLAIPDFPLAFGKVIPPITTQAIAINFLHRIGALIVTICIVATFITIRRNYKNEKGLANPATVLLSAVVLQITLAAITVWTNKAPIPTTAHVATGAFVLGTSFYLVMRIHQYFRPTAVASEPALEQLSTI
jgi:cytochrome c oxidase assembly protein subunit 15